MVALRDIAPQLRFGALAQKRNGRAHEDCRPDLLPSQCAGMGERLGERLCLHREQWAALLQQLAAAGYTLIGPRLRSRSIAYGVMDHPTDLRSVQKVSRETRDAVAASGRARARRLQRRPARGAGRQSLLLLVDAGYEPFGP